MTPEQLYAYVKANKDAILAANDSGNINARTIVRTYNMLVRHPDHIALGLLEQAVEDWRKDSEAKP